MPNCVFPLWASPSYSTAMIQIGHDLDHVTLSVNFASIFLSLKWLDTVISLCDSLFQASGLAFKSPYICWQ